MSNLEHAIKKTQGPCVILAGAGTGKTTAIVEKVKYLVENKIYEPEKIVCITFSNEAANNLLLRVQKALQLPVGKEPVIKTFHAFSADLLKKHGTRIGISEKFKILDPEQAMILLHRNLKVHVNYCQKYISTIGTVKDVGISIEAFRHFLERAMRQYVGIDLQKHFENLNFELQTLHLRKGWSNKKELLDEIKQLRQLQDIKKFVVAWNAYEKLKAKEQYQDYSDLNAQALALLKTMPELAQEYAYVIIDEFQDTNKLQLDFLVNLASHRNITVVGDMNQSIYRFRGAYNKNLQLFKQAFGVTERDIFTLARSYRSPNRILRVAHQLISKNYADSRECFFVENAHQREGEHVEAFQLENAQEEARKVVELIRKEQQRGVSFEEMCVIFRAHQQGRVVKRALEQAGIPYTAVSRASLLKQKSVKSVYDYLIILNKLKKKDSGGEQAWWDLLYLMDFSQEDLVVLGRVMHALSSRGRKRATAPANGDGYKEERTPAETNETRAFSVAFLEAIQHASLSDTGKISVKMLGEKIKTMLPLMNMPLSPALQEIYRLSGLLKGKKTREEREAMLNLQKFYDLAKTHEELYDSDFSNFLYYLEILQNLGIDVEAAQLEEQGVRLMTCHATKGLEYQTVILTNFAQGRFPIERYIGNPLIPTELLPEVRDELQNLSPGEREQQVLQYEKHHQLLEERRLAYVSFTRTKEKLFLTFAKEYSGKKALPSCFLDETSYLQNPDIFFVKDEALLHHEPQSAATVKVHFESALHSEQFDQALTTLVQQHDTKEREQRPRLSPSALLLFADCQKEFEYRYLYHMPERKTFSWEAMRLGSFVHLVLEQGVQACFSSLQEFFERAQERALDEEWQGISLDEAKTLIHVFFERNKGRYSAGSKTEQYLTLRLADTDFIGFADRIDFNADSIDIIDYKTGKTTITPQERNWQLGFYALAAQEKYRLPARRVVLDMLKQERPLEFEFDTSGNAHCISSKFIPGFSLPAVKEELIASAQAIKKAYIEGFKPCPIEKNCEFCNEYVYGE